MDDKDKLPYYPYRDDGLLLYEKLDEFVDAYIDAYGILHLFSSQINNLTLTYRYRIKLSEQNSAFFFIYYDRAERAFTGL